MQSCLTMTRIFDLISLSRAGRLPPGVASAT
jgi:hypothetical protein